MRLAYKAACLCGFHNWWDAGGGERVCLECGEQERSQVICPDAGRGELMKPKLMYVISEDWFFCSHFLERALAARDAGYDVVVMARERAHGQKIRAAGFRLLPVNFDRRSINPVKELMLLLRIYLAYRRERPDVLHHIACRIGGSDRLASQAGDRQCAGRYGIRVFFSAAAGQTAATVTSLGLPVAFESATQPRDL